MRRKHTGSCLLRRQVCTTVQLHPCHRGLLSETSGRRSPGVGVGGAKKNKITASLSDRSTSQTRGLQSTTLGRKKQTSEAARLPQATLCLVSSEAATKPPTHEQCPRPRCRSLPGRRRTPFPTDPSLGRRSQGCFWAALFPGKRQPFHPAPAGRTERPPRRRGMGPAPAPSPGSGGRCRSRGSGIGHPLLCPRGRGRCPVP